MMRRILLSWLISVSLLKAAELETFTEPRAAISAAKTQGKLIVFLLADAKKPEHQTIAEGLREELNRMSSEFILVNCAHSVKTSRDLFSVRFNKDLATLPIAVISSDAGEEISAHQGTQDELGYERMIIQGRIKGGLVKDPVKLAMLRENLAQVGETGGIFGSMVKDMKVQRTAITEMREWNRKDGTSFKAILLRALGDSGVFIDSRGNSTQIKFADLSDENIEYLQTILTVKKSG